MLWRLVGIISLLVGMGVAQGLSPNKVRGENSQSGCPVELEPLMDKMLADLPGYANRVMQRNRNGGDSFRASNVILAGRAEFEPLPLGPGKPIPEDPRQVFITTLERTYSRDDRVLEIQHFHWLFLTKTQDGWHLALMFSSIDGARDGRPPSLPRENSQGAIAQAIRNWLRDCRAARPPRARS
ncbi:MAG: hypothetical protein GDA48_21110 [Hormoscilla sp. GM102CHS1]|nr:hypothetical protein [Hormoscilla sp. GM102CHS1]